MDTTDWRQERAARGLKQADVARAAGTSSSNVSAYEIGSKTPKAGTAARIEACISAGADSPIHRHRLLTVPACAARIRRDLRAGERDNAALLRHVAQMLSHAAHVDDDLDVAAFVSEPSTTGDRRWDTLLAAAVERLVARRAWGDPPTWTNAEPLATCWFVGRNRTLHAYAFAHSPAAMHARGIMVDPADLESV